MFSELVLITVLGLSWTPVSGLPCTQIFPSPSPPSNVNSIRPSDVAAFATIGTHGHGAELSTVTSRLRELMTLFNPALISPPSDGSSSYAPQYVRHSTLLEQAKEVSPHLQNNQSVAVGRDWKLLLLFIQMDQFCACEQQQVEAVVKAVVQEVDNTLRFLHSQLRRAIVSVAVWDGERDRFLSRMCACTETNSEGEVRLQRALLTHALQESLEDLIITTRRYGNRDDFTVVLQETPLISDMLSVSSATPQWLSQQTDNLLVQMWTHLLQPQNGQPPTDDRGKIVSLPCPTEDRPYLRTEGNSPSYASREAPPRMNPHTGTEVPCEDLSSSPSIPTSVHKLRPGDIKVVAAVGDSLTAGNGIAASPHNILDVLTQYRGLSWSIGGEGNLTSVTTLPNILKHFNPNVTGYSSGIGKQDTPQAFLNQAVAGAKTKDLAPQIKALVARMKNTSGINFESDWKLITIFIGGNDICDHCQNTLLFSAENYVRHIRDSLDYLHKEVPRALVNLVEPLSVTPLRELHMDPSLKCPTWLLNFLCPCVILPKSNSEALQKVEKLNRQYQRVLHDLVESSRYDTREDFTVVIQPFFREIVLPRLPDGRPDRSFFSADCFHLSQRAQTLMARSLWNNMLEPLGNKTYTQDFTANVSLKCPSKASPFIRTFNNSDYTYVKPSPAPEPNPNWGSDFSCVNLAASQTVPTSVHKLRPADITVVAALGDSVTVGTAAKSKNLFELNRKYKGVSWSIGGDNMLESVTTLPNILKKFNPSLKGFSKDKFPKQNGLNMAVAGAKASETLQQAKDLIKAMKENKDINFENDWKLVTIFTGGKDLCEYCTDQNNLSPKNYSQSLMLTLDMLFAEMPRVLVNVVQLMEIHLLKTVKRNTLGCSLLQRTSCPCVVNADETSPELQEIKRVNHEYQVEIQHLISGNRYDGKDDFAVVLQPFLQTSFIPNIGVGEVDTSFFSVDCFHISERAHAEMAIALWNNMLEPVGRKQAFNNFTYDRSKIHCPTEVHPYIFTKVNSQNHPEISPTTTTTHAPASSSTTSSVTPPPLPECPPSLPVWIPVVVGLGCFLGGLVVSLKILYCYRCHKNKSANEVEMKGVNF
ncbi:phospholipase B1, membrane-associated-like [Takifugu flavidus]|uniref:phospholipase B1, membrane-associated-like n=1 Tax=Takifugu flavidus TaxID=433684 RepID=UPI0025448DE4|nr:phospholipase B1, membrane-associated-like [Takifugu flavidus]